MRRDRSLNRTGWTLTRSCFVSALALVAIVNIIYVWPGRLGGVAGTRATPTVGRRTTAQLQSRKQLAATKATTDDALGSLTVHLHCGDQAPDCEQQRHAGKCSTHLLQGFHTCMASCGVCPALERALRASMNLTQQQLVVVVESGSGPPACQDGATAVAARECARLAAAADGAQAACARSPLPVVGACKATCGACLRPELDPTAVTGPGSGSGSGSGSAGAKDRCFDAADMCAWWAARDPRVCERAASDLQRWWWVAAACRRSCGLCGAGAEQGEASGGGSSGHTAVAAAAAALAAAARLGVQVGLAADGSPGVAVYEAVPDDSASCVDVEAQCGTWAAAGECSRNPGFMASTCPAACRACPLVVNLPQPLAKVRLNNGVLLPTVGYGSAGLGTSTGQAVRWALNAGYRHIDSAQAREWYREDLVGQALAEFLAEAEAGGVSGGVVRREEVFVTSKLHPRHLGYKTTLRQFNDTLRDLSSPYVDLFLLHYAECWGDLCGGVVPEGTFLDSWRALEELYEAGLARAIGVSNFSPAQLSELLAAARVRPAVLQTHVDPLGRSEAHQELCRREGVTLTAYSTLGTQWGGAANPVLGHPQLQLIGREAGGRSAAQVALRWALQQGLVVLPRSSNQERIRQNLEMYDWGLPAAAVARIAHLRPAAGV